MIKLMTNLLLVLFCCFVFDMAAIQFAEIIDPQIKVDLALKSVNSGGAGELRAYSQLSHYFPLTLIVLNIVAVIAVLVNTKTK